MKLPAVVALMVMQIFALYATAATATDAGKIKILDARIADARKAAIVASKAADTVCGNAGYAMGQRDQGLPNNASRQFKQCTEAIQVSNDANGFVGYLYEQRAHLTGQPMPSKYACSGKASLGAPHPDANGHYTECPKDPDDHSYKFWMITQVHMKTGSAKETWSDGGIISMGRYRNENECRLAIAKLKDYPSKIPYALDGGVMVGDVCVEVFIPNVRELQRLAPDDKRQW